MNKEDYIWVAIRIFGIYLLVLAVIEIPTFISSLTTLLCAIPHEEADSPLFGLSQQLTSISLNSITKSTASLFLYTLAGLYLLRRGNILFRWITPPKNDN